ncbi:related to lipase serine esterase [Lecanosticta acicola]|uniref:Related to lipase serine esterase n=1 Tax=Lecanosticta acicola TaxID=111012 RepID=A0AAI8Z6S4_9PEZI|nr:related to lipase serine esterase [Lecanosticta acicola]
MGDHEQPKAEHLAVLIHGLWGNPNHLTYLRDTLRKQYSEDELHILVAKSNSDNQTYDGVEVGGERIVNEVEQELSRLEEKGHKVTKISLTGYSLGGLVARYAVGLFYKNGLFDRIQPVNFTTFATPHLGVRTPNLGYRSYVWNFLGAKTLSTSGQQLFLVDDFRGTGRNLLSILADPNSAFVKGLNLFKHKWLYANTLNDRSVPYYTAMMSRTDPYRELDKIDVHYLEGQPPPGEVLLDPQNPVSPKKSPDETMTFSERWRTVSQRTINNLPFYLILFSVLPLALPAFMINAGYQTYKSAQRVRHHESGKAFKLDRYRFKLLEEAQAVEDRVYERLAGQQPEQYLPTPESESQSTSETGSRNKETLELSRRESHKEKSPFPILALKQEQFDMIENLDTLAITKYPVHIHKVRHTHAAVVVRTLKDSFAEGKVVVQHWVEKFEL